MPNLKVNYQVIDKRVVTVPATIDSISVEELGTAIKRAGEDGYFLKEMKHLSEERGTQRDPYRVTIGVELHFSKS